MGNEADVFYVTAISGKDEVKRCKKLQEERQDEVIRKYFMMIIR